MLNIGYLKIDGWERRVKRSAIFLKFVLSLLAAFVVFQSDNNPILRLAENLNHQFLSENQICSQFLNINFTIHDIIQDCHVGSSQDSLLSDAIDESEEDSIDLLLGLKISSVLRPFSLSHKFSVKRSDDLPLAFLSLPLRC